LGEAVTRHHSRMADYAPLIRPTRSIAFFKPRAASPPRSSLAAASSSPANSTRRAPRGGVTRRLWRRSWCPVRRVRCSSSFR